MNCQAQISQSNPNSSNSSQSAHIQSFDSEPNAEIENTPIKPRPDGTEFSDILQDYQDLNSRIIRLQAPLRLANIDLCPKTKRDPGYITHRLEDYPPHMRAMAQEFLGLSDDGIFIRNVRDGSPANIANIQTGDEIIAINDKAIADVGGATQARFYDAIARNAFNGVRTRLTLQPSKGPQYKTKLRAQTACDIPASVIFSEDVNGYTNGAEILVTSALMKSVTDDINLSLILAHEMSHIIAGHMHLEPSSALELEADRMALVLMQNAGLDIDKAIQFWQQTRHPHSGLQNTSATHPSLNARYENFRKEQRRIKKLVSKGRVISFE